jgi:DNA-binding PadR family transcriptional regulator
MRHRGFGRQADDSPRAAGPGDPSAVSSVRARGRDGRSRRRGGGHGGRGSHGGSRGGGGRGRRGDVRAAVLALLAERPMHGYEMLQELARRTQDLWRPSPGSLYPALQLLEDQGLVQSVEADGRRRFELTDGGRAEQAARPAGPLPWETMLGAADPGDMALHATLRQVEVAIGQVAEAGTPGQKIKAEALLAELRRQIYLLLAEPPMAEASGVDH